MRNEDTHRATSREWYGKNTEASKARFRAYYAANAEKLKRRARERQAAQGFKQKRRYERLWSLYRLSAKQFDDMFEAQGKKCACCETPEPGGVHNQWNVDHDHRCCAGQKSCGKCVRAILCARCNAGIGHFLDSAEKLRQAAAYLDRFTETTECQISRITLKSVKR